jgi:hypothetical protein
MKPDIRRLSHQQSPELWQLRNRQRYGDHRVLKKNRMSLYSAKCIKKSILFYENTLNNGKCRASLNLLESCVLERTLCR